MSRGARTPVEPRRIVEVGSGYSSTMTLDTTERWLDGDVDHLDLEVPPRLAPGVWTHLRALLTFKDTFEIRWSHDSMWHHRRRLLEARLPLMAKSSGGNSWLRVARARA